MTSSINETRIAIPKSELLKLEKDRVALYELLENKRLFDKDGQGYLNLIEFMKLTKNMWKIANTKNWSDDK